MGEIQYHVQKQNRENKPRNIPDRKKELEYFFNILVIFPSASISVILLHSPDCIPSSKSVSSPNFILFTSGDDRLVIILVTKRGTSADGGSKPKRRTHVPLPFLSFLPLTATWEMLYFKMASLPISTGEDCKVLDTIKWPLKIVPPILYV